MANVALNTVEKLQAKRSVFCLLIQTQEKYFYVLVSGENMLALKSKLSGGTLDLKKYGVEMLCIEWNGVSQLAENYKHYCAPFGLTELRRNEENIIFAL